MTKPTTIKAITETPAKTPRPMGKTSSFLPGVCAAASAAAGVGVETAVETCPFDKVVTTVMGSVPVAVLDPPVVMTGLPVFEIEDGPTTETTGGAAD